MPKHPVRARTRRLEAPSGAVLALWLGIAAFLLIVTLVIVPH